jgi:RNA polymerase sigma-70 factor (ECF subfamily)
VTERSIDDELLARYRSADFRGFDLFYQRNHALILKFLTSRLGNRVDAEDAFQETFLRIHKSILRYDVTQKALPWVFTIARNVAVDIARARQRRKQHDAAVDIAVTPRTEQALIAREDLRAMMGYLTNEERVLLEARLFNEDDFDTIAAKQGITSANTRQKISRLMRKLRRT